MLLTRVLLRRTRGGDDVIPTHIFPNLTQSHDLLISTADTMIFMFGQEFTEYYAFVASDIGGGRFSQPKTGLKYDVHSLIATYLYPLQQGLFGWKPLSKRDDERDDDGGLPVEALIPSDLDLMAEMHEYLNSSKTISYDCDLVLDGDAFDSDAPAFTPSVDPSAISTPTALMPNSDEPLEEDARQATASQSGESHIDEPNEQFEHDEFEQKEEECVIVPKDFCGGDGRKV